LNNCSANANCTNTIGNYTCSCKVGYTGDGIICTETYPPCPGTPECNGQGTCIQGTCKCNATNFGPDCSIEGTVPVNLNISVPSNPALPPSILITPLLLSTPQFSIFAKNITEIDEFGNIIKFYALNSRNYSVSQRISILPDKSTATYINISFPLLEKATLLIITAHYDTPQSIPFANQNVPVAGNGTKYSMVVENWDFLSTNNQLDIVMGMTTSANTSQSVQTSAGGGSGLGAGIGTIQWMDWNVAGISLYAKFLEYAVIDGVVQMVKFIYQDALDGTPEIHVIVPHFLNSAEIDPNYSVLLNPKDENNSANDNDSNHHSSSRWLTYKTIIIIVASVFGAAILFVIAGCYVKRRERIQASKFFEKK